MKKLVAAILLVFLFHHTSHAQLTKGNWMVGGNGSFSTGSYNLGGNDTKTTSLSLSPSIGYFIADRFPVGLRLNLSNYHDTSFNATTGSSAIGNNFSLSIGPFARYYFFKQVDRPVNLFVEANYSIGYNTEIERIKYALNRFSFIAGPVLYLNNSIGLEFTIGYYRNYSQQFGGTTTTGFQAGFGLQIHLEKEK